LFLAVFRAALNDLRAVEKLSVFGSEAGAALQRAGQLLVCWPSGARDGRAPLILGRELLGCQVAQNRVRPLAIVFDSPLLDLAACIVEGREDMLVETLLAQPRFAGRDGVRCGPGRSDWKGTTDRGGFSRRPQDIRTLWHDGRLCGCKDSPHLALRADQTEAAGVELRIILGGKDEIRPIATPIVIVITIAAHTDDERDARPQIMRESTSRPSSSVPSGNAAEVATATNACEGWHMFQSIQPQLVTLDIVMPNVEGLDAFSLLGRIHKEAPNTAVFIVSGSNSVDDRGRFMQAGAIAFVSKPFVDFEKFLDRLSRLFPAFDGKAVYGLRSPPRLNVRSWDQAAAGWDTPCASLEV
jgi:CheY-like chemotaxis protein